MSDMIRFPRPQDSRGNHPSGRGASRLKVKDTLRAHQSASTPPGSTVSDVRGNDGTKRVCPAPEFPLRLGVVLPEARPPSWWTRLAEANWIESGLTDQVVRVVLWAVLVLVAAGLTWHAWNGWLR